MVGGTGETALTMTVGQTDSRGMGGEIKRGIRQEWIGLHMTKCVGERSKDSLSNN
jgi:hypothetical protein